MGSEVSPNVMSLVIAVSTLAAAASTAAAAGASRRTGGGGGEDDSGGVITVVLCSADFSPSMFLFAPPMFVEVVFLGERVVASLPQE
jgi:hypothetical protein